MPTKAEINAAETAVIELNPKNRKLAYLARVWVDAVLPWDADEPDGEKMLALAKQTAPILAGRIPETPAIAEAGDAYRADPSDTNALALTHAWHDWTETV